MQFLKVLSSMRAQHLTRALQECTQLLLGLGCSCLRNSLAGQLDVVPYKAADRLFHLVLQVNMQPFLFPTPKCFQLLKV